MKKIFSNYEIRPISSSNMQNAYTRIYFQHFSKYSCKTVYYVF